MHSTRVSTWLLSFLGVFVVALFFYQFTSIARHGDYYVAHHFGNLTDRLRTLAYFFGSFLFALGIIVTRMKQLPWRRYWILALIIVVALASISFATRPTRSQDAYWSLLLGKGFTEFHLNPYTTTPSDLAHDAWAYPILAWKDIPMIYGPVWTILLCGIAKAVSSLGATLLLLKSVMLFFLILTGVLFWKCMSLLKIPDDQRQKIFLLMAWNPFIWQVALVDAHNDLLILTSMLASLYFLLKKNYAASILALTLGGLVKYVSFIFILIPLWQMLRDTTLSKSKKLASFNIAVIISIILIIIMYVPFGGFSLQSFIGLSAQVERIGLPSVFLPGTALLIKLFHFDFSQLRILGLAVAIAVMYVCLRKQKILLAYTLPLILIFFFATPWFQSWYGLWLLPIASLYWPVSITVLVSIFLVFTPELIAPAVMSIQLTAYATFVYGIKRIYSLVVNK